MTVEAYAKVNLTLEVFNRRSDGFHALRSVVLPISLADTLEIEDAPELSSDTGYSDDLCLKAARVLDPTRGARIRVVKRIPAGGGLGGGSADAAATLLALNDIWGLKRSRTELAEIGAEVGSDVPALVLGGPVLMEGRGEKVSRLGRGRETGDDRREAGEDARQKSRNLNLVLANPGVFCSTAEVYARCVPRPLADAGASDLMRQALESGDLKAVAAALTNDLQTPAMVLHPEIRETMEVLKSVGAEGVLMSGSGSTVFGLVSSEAKGRAIAAALSSRGLWSKAVHAII